MAKRKPVPQIAGPHLLPRALGVASKPRSARLAPGATVMRGASAPSHTCLDCGEPMIRDESQPRPFDMTCESCRAIRDKILDRLDECLISLLAIEANESSVLFIPVRPGWKKWRRIKEQYA